MYAYIIACKVGMSHKHKVGIVLPEPSHLYQRFLPYLFRTSTSFHCKILYNYDIFVTLVVNHIIIHTDRSSYCILPLH